MNTTSRIDHVVWDWNGTLFDDASVSIECTIEAFASLGLPEVTVERCRKLFIQPIPVFYERLAGRELDEEEQRALRDAYWVAYRHRHATATLNADAAAALRWVDDRGLSQSLLSMYPHADLVPLVRRLGIEPHFDRVDGRPEPDRGVKSGYLATHLKRLGLRGSQVLMVGDSVDDARAAATAGAACVLYTSGMHAPEALRAEGVPVAGSLPEALQIGTLGGAA